MNKSADELGEVVTVVEAGRLLRVSNEYVRRLCRSGKLPARKVGRSWRIIKRDLLAYVGLVK